MPCAACRRRTSRCRSSSPPAGRSCSREIAAMPKLQASSWPWARARTTRSCARSTVRPAGAYPFIHGRLHTLPNGLHARRQLSLLALQHEHRPADDRDVPRRLRRRPAGPAADLDALPLLAQLFEIWPKPADRYLAFQPPESQQIRAFARLERAHLKRACVGPEVCPDLYPPAVARNDLSTMRRRGSIYPAGAGDVPARAPFGRRTDCLDPRVRTPAAAAPSA